MELLLKEIEERRAEDVEQEEKKTVRLKRKDEEQRSKMGTEGILCLITYIAD